MKKIIIFIKIPLSFLFVFILLSSVTAQNNYEKKYITITPGAEYEAGWFYCLFFGKHWRDVWTQPVKVEILNLNKFAGGLTPIKRGGGFQTKSLRLKGKDGHIWKFRSMEKDPSKILPENLRESIVADVFKDQISSANPMAALVVAPILDSVGVLQARPYLVYMPDDKKLGTFQTEFGGMLGMIEIHPDVDKEEGIHFENADDVKGTIKLFKRLLKKRSEKIDSKEYLKARLIDIFIGDWDRHTDQWKWALYKKNGKKFWEPIPRDRDQAFAKWDGLGPSIAEYFVPQFVHFGFTYPNVRDITWSGRYIDRRHLTELTKPQWDSVTAFVQNRLTDNVIDNAVSKLPPEDYPLAANEIASKLKSRRNLLKKISNDYYNLINNVVDINCTDKDELVNIERTSDNLTEVTVIKRKKKETLYHKVFDNKITNEIRIYLEGGDDKAIVKGDVSSSPLIRVIGGKGKDTLIDNSIVRGYFLSFIPIPDAENKTKFYDGGKKTIVKKNKSTSYCNNKVTEPKTDLERFEPKQKDRGYDLWNFPLLNLNSDDGLVLGGQSIYYKYNFRAVPYDYKISLSATYATEPNNYSLHLKTYFNTLIKNTTLNVNIIRTGLHFTKYHGYGNETSFSKKLDEINFYRLEEELLKITPMLYFNLFNKAMSGIGISYEYSNINLTNNSLLLETKRDNYGLGKLKLVGTHLLFNIDTRDNITNPYKGIFLNIKGSLYPKLLDVKETFYKLEFDARTYFKTKIITDNIFAFRIGGGKLWNDYPFSKSIVLGGENNLRGFSRERFSGDASLFAQAEIRTYLVPIKYGLPGKFGIHFFGETGRVFTENDNSKKWHLSYGGGVWLSLIDRMVSLSFDMAVSEEFNNFYLRFSMPF